MSGEPLLEIRGLNKTFYVKKHPVRALQDVTFTIYSGEILALVGESGSGKSTLARTLTLLYRPDSGQMIFGGENVQNARGKRLYDYRQEIQMVFQDPFSSLNPAHTVQTIMVRGLPKRQRAKGHELQTQVGQYLQQVGLAPPENFLHQYPHELSGGQRQRVAFARALSRSPKLVIADEPVSMLDVSLRLGLLNLMIDINRDTGLTYLYITHDLASARYIGNRVVVMYAGEIVELGTGEEVVDDALHPYTQLLIEAAPDPERNGASLELNEENETPATVRSGFAETGCKFRNRCAWAGPYCEKVSPPLLEVSPSRFVRCHRHNADVVLQEGSPQGLKLSS